MFNQHFHYPFRFKSWVSRVRITMIRERTASCARLWRCHFYPKVTSNRCLKDWKGRCRQPLLESSQITSEPRGSKVGHGLPHPGPCTCSPFVPTTTSKVGTMDSTAEQQESQTCLSISCSSYFTERHV